MVRTIKRYGSRKLYDTKDSKYISLETIAELIRKGEEIQVKDNKTSDDVTAQTLMQVISEEGRKGSAFLPTELLHDLIRSGQQTVSQSVRQIQDGVDRFVKRSLDRLGPVRQAREEMTLLTKRLAELESSLAKIEEMPEANGSTAKSATKTAPKK
jgi:polyhydroxyalkanoate synthesis repressor PhaR